MALFIAISVVEAPETPAQPKETGTPLGVPVSKLLPLSLEVADTPALQAHGLSDRLSMPRNHGMLFVFDPPSDPGFWMKDMHFPLDMIWLDANKHIVKIDSNVLPESYPNIFTPPGEIKYVIEVNAGVAAELGLSVGDIVDWKI